MIQVERFREQLLTGNFEPLLEGLLHANSAVHVSDENIGFLRQTISSRFRSTEEVQVVIVGSAKLGFSLTEKQINGDGVLERYRPFSPASDIDVAVICPSIFNAIWDDLSGHANRNASFLPWNSNKLGDYLVHGWLRPDYFPKNVRLRHCDDWWDVFHRLSADARFGRRKVRGGLFYSIKQLQRYQLRSLNECYLAERLKT